MSNFNSKNYYNNIELKESYMPEFTNGIFELLKKIIGGSSFMLAAIYTMCHVVIAMTVVSLMTGASLWEAGSVALVEPAINGVWFYVLHSAYKKITNKNMT